MRDPAANSAGGTKLRCSCSTDSIVWAGSPLGTWVMGETEAASFKPSYRQLPKLVAKISSPDRSDRRASLASWRGGISREIQTVAEANTMTNKPVTPHAGPTLDGDGNLTYIGDDGRRYVVGLPPEIDEDSVERVMTMLRGSSPLFQDIEGLCHRWIKAVSSEELDARAALVLLLTTLETALEDAYPDNTPG